MRASRTVIRALVLVAVAVVVLLAGYFAAIAPQRSRAHRLETEVAAAQAQVASLEALRSDAANASPAELYQLARALPASDDVPDVLLELDRLAGGAHVTLSSVTPAAETPPAGGWSALPLTVVVDGRYAQVTAFLRLLRSEVRVTRGRIVAAGRLFAVDGVQLALGSATSSVTATLKVDAFVYSPAPPVTGTTTTTSAATPPGAEAAR